MNEENDKKNEEEVKKTEEMIRYEKETGKYSIWRGHITEGFKKWQVEGPIKSFKTIKRFYGNGGNKIHVPEEIKNKWRDQAKQFGYTSFSKFLIDAVRYFVDFNKLDSNLVNKKVQQISQEKIELDILVIDDALDIIEYLSNIFKSKGFSFKAAISGIEGLKILDNIMPKVILIDILLPDMVGYDVFIEIKKKKEFKDNPIYFITAFPESSVQESLKEYKINPAGVILEPLDNNSLNEVIAYLSKEK